MHDGWIVVGVVLVVIVVVGVGVMVMVAGFMIYDARMDGYVDGRRGRWMHA